MGEKAWGGHLDWGFVCGYIPVNAQGAQWDCKCFPVNAQGDQRDCGCIPDRACERTGSPVGLYCLWRWPRSPEYAKMVYYYTHNSSEWLGSGRHGAWVDFKQAASVRGGSCRQAVWQGAQGCRRRGRRRDSEELCQVAEKGVPDRSEWADPPSGWSAATGFWPHVAWEEERALGKSGRTLHLVRTLWGTCGRTPALSSQQGCSLRVRHVSRKCSQTRQHLVLRF